MNRDGSREAGRSSSSTSRRRAAAGPTVLALALLAAASALVLVALRGPSSAGTMAERVRAVAADLRCPVCQNLTVADSPSQLAQEMRRTIARDLRAGKSPDEIREGFVRAYGAWILESPPKRGIDLVAWLVPAILVLGGVAAASWAVWRWTGRGLGIRPRGMDAEESGAPLSSHDRSLLERALAGAPEESE